MALSCCSGIGPQTVSELCRLLVSSSELSSLREAAGHLFSEYDVRRKLESGGHALGINRVATLLETLPQLGALFDAETEICDRFGVSLVTLWDTDLYPPALELLPTPPPVIWCKGKPFPDLSASIALVGSRAADQYGLGAVEQLVVELVEAGFATISGGALGIDTAVHRETIKKGGHTVAVLGGGLGCPYPPENAALFDCIAGVGTLVSLVPYHMFAHKGLFHARNVIIAALASMTIVVQAAAKSGALGTAQSALELNRSVGAVPGPITSPLSRGTNRLLREGAALVESARDVIDELGDVKQYGTPEKRTQKEIPEKSSQQKLFSEHLPSPTVEQKLLVLMSDQPRFVSDIARILSIEAHEVYKLLYTLAQEGRVVQDYRGYWQIT